MLFAKGATALKVRDESIAERGRHANVRELPGPINHSVDAGQRRAGSAQRTTNIGLFVDNGYFLLRQMKGRERRRPKNFKRRSAAHIHTSHRSTLLVQRR
jgi:hypothetical protein